jgi:hypothetical protein
MPYEKVNYSVRIKITYLHTETKGDDEKYIGLGHTSRKISRKETTRET